MNDEFTGTSLPLDSSGFQMALDKLGVMASQFWAILHVETSGCGFGADRRPTILYERHVFSKRTGGRFDERNPDISNSQAGGYGAAGDHQYVRLKSAMLLDRRAALESTSWGIGQVMGFNAPAVGYSDIEQMVDAMCASEALQVLAMADFVNVNQLGGPLRSNDWGRFAAGYNGLNYRINNYDTRLAAAFDAADRGALPDLDIRTGQLILTYLGIDPQGIDGVMGKFTRSAMNEFQSQHGLAQTDSFNDATLQALRGALAGFH